MFLFSNLLKFDSFLFFFCVCVNLCSSTIYGNKNLKALIQVLILVTYATFFFVLLSRAFLDHFPIVSDEFFLLKILNFQTLLESGSWE